jgi:hypothetical protein
MIFSAFLLFSTLPTPPPMKLAPPVKLAPRAVPVKLAPPLKLAPRLVLAKLAGANFTGIVGITPPFVVETFVGDAQLTLLPFADDTVLCHMLRVVSKTKGCQGGGSLSRKESFDKFVGPTTEN